MLSPGERRRIVVATTGLDHARDFVGGPAGNLTNVGLIVPSAATVDQNHRYFGRLASFFVPARTRAIITSIKQLLTIASPVPTADSQGRGTCVMNPAIYLEREVKSPFWSLPDGNVLWFLRALPVLGNIENYPVGYLQGWSSNPYGLEPAWLYSSAPPPAAYVPPNNGVPIGIPLGSFGTMFGIEFPYRSGKSSETDINVQAEGPCIVSMGVSIWQGNPATRLIPDLGALSTTESGLEQEDLFWINFNCANYYRVGAELTAYLEPIPDSKCPNEPQAPCPNPNPSRSSEATCMDDDPSICDCNKGS